MDQIPSLQHPLSRPSQPAHRCVSLISGLLSQFQCSQVPQLSMGAHLPCLRCSSEECSSAHLDSSCCVFSHVHFSRSAFMVHYVVLQLGMHAYALFSQSMTNTLLPFTSCTGAVHVFLRYQCTPCRRAQHDLAVSGPPQRG